MDEILIDEKKYVSSKRAAKVTGYAKDYIGQLCREGRVPARLVGRSWYVLETAIHDHRFGDQKIDEDTVLNTEPPAAGFPSTWESPRYESSPAQVLPSINRLRDTDHSIPEDTRDDEVSQKLHDSWRAWFDRVADVEATAPAATFQAKEKGAEKQEIEEIEEGEVSVPIRALHQQIPEELLPRRSYTESGFQADSSSSDFNDDETQRTYRRVFKTIQILGALLAALMLFLALMSTGYFDYYAASSKQVGVITGVSLYNK
ncbi:MAG: hypothetical protein ACYC75_00135 [Minisyncoccota bacterium]